MGNGLRRFELLLAVMVSGACGLSWEVLWQHHAALALGVSSEGTAITLGALMSGLGLGGLLASHLSRRGWLPRPMLAYGMAELVIGLGGWLAPQGFHHMATLDTQLYASSPMLAATLRVALTGLILLAPALAMGATIPILAPHAARVGSDIAVVYAVNTFGAVVGVLAATFFVLPSAGVAATAVWTATLNGLVALWAFGQGRTEQTRDAEDASPRPTVGPLVLAAGSGMAVFMLEVSWFRSMRAAFQSSTESFAVMLAAFLLCLSLGAWLAPRVRAYAPDPLWWLPPLAALAILATTPAVDRIDRLVQGGATTLAGSLGRLVGAVTVVLAPVTLLGMVFPSLLSKHDSTSGTGRLYAANTSGSVIGALAAGFLLLPTLGATHTSWLAALLIGVAGLAMHPGGAQLSAMVLALGIGGGAAAMGVDDAASRRVQGHHGSGFEKVVQVRQGPDSTLWVTEDAKTGRRALVIDGFLATSEGPNTEYMAWMGHLPALATERPERALVICFGTGRTAHAVWQHGPDRLDVVDVNPAVFDAADLFESNRGVLGRRNVHATVMDGRAYLRRHTGARFDLVTLEPMPPNFAGVNNLYSTEFYRLVAARLSTRGVVAQWVPYHLLSAGHMRGIVASFREAFPHARLWHDPASGTGILLGAPHPWSLRDSEVRLELTAEEIERQFVLDASQLSALVGSAHAVTDDNQLLAYGRERLRRSADNPERWARDLARRNHEIVQRAARRP